MIRNLKPAGAAALAFLTTAGVSATSFAQDVQAQGQVGMALPGAAPAGAVAGDSDHDRMVGTLGVGYLGRRGMTVGSSAGVENVAAPVVGIRYWVDELLGIDAGLGFAINSASQSADPGGDTDLPGTTAFILHVGVPLSLADEGHFSFQIVPEANVGFAGWSDDEAETSGSGFHLDIGARAGAEIHFGFIDIPQLSLQGSVGAAFAMDKASFEDADGNEGSISTTRIGTTVQDNPWNIFVSNVAAIYYF